MDGVQADFFGAWADHHNVPSYKDIPAPETAIDMLAASGPKAVFKFFAELKPLAGGQRIIQWLKEYDIPCVVMSAPLRGQMSASIAGKKAWLDKYNPGTSQDAIFTADKFRYAMNQSTPQVLVDDFGPYIRAWHAAGGITVKHDELTTDDTIAQLEIIYNGIKT